MALIKNEIPILEFDSEAQAILMPEHGWDCKFTKKAVMLFMEAEIEEYVLKNKCEIIGQFESVTKTFYVYKTILYQQRLLDRKALRIIICHLQGKLKLMKEQFGQSKKH